jgi:hypothetical protein
MGIDEKLFIPDVADAAGVAGGIDAGAPILFGSAATGGEIDVFAVSESGGFLDADDVVFEAEIGIDLVFGLEMAGDDAGTVFKNESFL